MLILIFRIVQNRLSNPPREQLQSLVSIVAQVGLVNVFVNFKEVDGGEPRLETLSRQMILSILFRHVKVFELVALVVEEVCVAIFKLKPQGVLFKNEIIVADHLFGLHKGGQQRQPRHLHH